MNRLKFNNKIYFYESFWRPSKNILIYDYDNLPLPYPSSKHIDLSWYNKDVFLDALVRLQNSLSLISFPPSKFKNCLLCNKKNVSTGLFSSNNIRWSNDLYHYISVHNIKPSNKFIEYVFNFNSTKRITSIKKKISTNFIKKYDKIFLKFHRNQILILDSLLKAGGSNSYVLDNDSSDIQYKFSEHFGMLDFNHSGLEHIIISANTNRIDDDDDDIFLPNDPDTLSDFEYYFHTHPPSPTINSRALDGIIYEFHSISDIFHFIDNYNNTNGNIQGSIVIASEGMYILRKLNFDGKIISFDEDKFYKKIRRLYNNIQDSALSLYGSDFSLSTFYNDIAQNKSFINKLNIFLNEYSLHIDYYPRIKDKNKWIIDTIYLPIFIFE